MKYDANLICSCPYVEVFGLRALALLRLAYLICAPTTFWSVSALFIYFLFFLSQAIRGLSAELAVLFLLSSTAVV